VKKSASTRHAPRDVPSKLCFTNAIADHFGEDRLQEPLGETSPAPANRRILSVDVLRGFDMFWIVVGGVFIVALLPFCGPTVVGRDRKGDRRAY
jgi:hypothetical protein